MNLVDMHFLEGGEQRLTFERLKEVGIRQLHLEEGGSGFRVQG